MPQNLPQQSISARSVICNCKCGQQQVEPARVRAVSHICLRPQAFESRLYELQKQLVWPITIVRLYTSVGPAEGRLPTIKGLL